MGGGSSRNRAPEPSKIAHFMRVMSVPIILGWLALTVISNMLVPQLEKVGEAHTVSMNAKDASSMVSMKKIGSNFQEFSSDSNAMVIMEGEQPLGDEAHHYYDQMVKKFEADTTHVEHVADFWGDPLTASGAQSNDGKSAYVQLYLHGNMGETLANQSIDAVRDMVASVPPPPGVKTYVTGGAALVADQRHAGDKGTGQAMMVTFAVIILMLLIVFRSIWTMVLILLMVFVEMGAARGFVALLGEYEIIGLSTFATGLLTLMVIAAGTDYAIFLIGRYQEARGDGEDKETAYYTMFRGTAHVVLGSGLTIAGSMLCLSFTRLPYFQTLGVPCAVGTGVAVIAALTLGPAIIAAGSRFGLFDPKRNIRSRGWRRVGTAVVRWPGPILVATIVLALIGLLTLPGYVPQYDNRLYLPSETPANEGYAAADRHFSAARMNPELLMIETDHDLRNSADFLIIDKVAKAIVRIPGISRVQAITRPTGAPLEHSTIPFALSMQGTMPTMNRKYSDTIASMLHQADELQTTVDTMEQMTSLTQQMAGVTHTMVEKLSGTLVDLESPRPDLRFRRLLQAVAELPLLGTALLRHPGVLVAQVDLRHARRRRPAHRRLSDLLPDLQQLDVLLPQLSEMLLPQIETMKSMKTMMLTQYQVQKGSQDQQAAASAGLDCDGRRIRRREERRHVLSAAGSLQQQGLQTGDEEFPLAGRPFRALHHQPRGRSGERRGHLPHRSDQAGGAEAIKGTPWEGSKIYLAGTGATYKDMRDGSFYDLLICGIAAVILIFIIMLVITRSLVAAAVIVGTVLLSLGASFGLSVLFWQHIIGLPLHWMVLAMSVILLLAVGSDYNLLLVSRFKEELPGGLKTGIIRAMAGTGSVVTSAGLVFAATMATFVVSDLKVMGQVGTTIALGLLFDTLIVRSFMTPAIAALMGKWFWWPQIVRARAARRDPRPTEPEAAPVAADA